MFDTLGVCKTTRGFELRLDTYPSNTIFYNIPQYGKFEAGEIKTSAKTSKKLWLKMTLYLGSAGVAIGKSKSGIDTMLVFHVEDLNIIQGS